MKTVNDALIESSAVTRMAVAFERIASALEQKTVTQTAQVESSQREVLRELLKHCERQSKAAKLRMVGYKNENYEYAPTKQAIEGNRKASEKWDRFANVIRDILAD